VERAVSVAECRERQRGRERTTVRWLTDVKLQEVDALPDMWVFLQEY
jgi:hypothetical protein